MLCMLFEASIWLHSVSTVRAGLRSLTIQPGNGTSASSFFSRLEGIFYFDGVALGA